MFHSVCFIVYASSDEQNPRHLHSGCPSRTKSQRSTSSHSIGWSPGRRTLTLNARNSCQKPAEGPLLVTSLSSFFMPSEHTDVCVWVSECVCVCVCAFKKVPPHHTVHNKLTVAWDSWPAVRWAEFWPLQKDCVGTWHFARGWARRGHRGLDCRREDARTSFHTSPPQYPTSPLPAHSRCPLKPDAHTTPGRTDEEQYLQMLWKLYGCFNLNLNERKWNGCFY